MRVLDCAHILDAFHAIFGRQRLQDNGERGEAKGLPSVAALSENVDGRWGERVASADTDVTRVRAKTRKWKANVSNFCGARGVSGVGKTKRQSKREDSNSTAAGKCRAESFRVKYKFLLFDKRVPGREIIAAAPTPLCHGGCVEDGRRNTAGYRRRR